MSAPAFAVGAQVQHCATGLVGLIVASQWATDDRQPNYTIDFAGLADRPFAGAEQIAAQTWRARDVAESALACIISNLQSGRVGAAQSNERPSS